mmetsp:Transcript_26823/g.46243  ORF Transcript_26823/g.46243 Transcript_26823/m.46243 type:complete len:398 (-) Transcript_26823:101-1294(-)
MITLVVCYHCLMFFQSGGSTDAILPNLTREYVNYILLFIGSSGWPMFTFFTLAGYAAFHSLRVRAVKDFVADRSLRLVPSMVFDMTILHPIAVFVAYFVLESKGISPVYYYNFFDFYVNGYWGCLIGAYTECLVMATSFGSWYFFYLYVLCIINIPLFLFWSKFPSPAVKTSLAKTATLFGFITFIFVLWGAYLLWISINELLFINRFAEHSFFSYLLCIWFGFFLAWSKDAHELLLASCWWFLGLAIGLASVIVVLGLSGQVETFTHTELLLVEVFAGSALYAAWGLAHKTLPFLPRRTGVVFDYIADRAIAIYVIHVLISVVVEGVFLYAFVGTIMDTETTLRFLIQFIATYLLSLALYESLFRYKYTKVLVGMLRISDLRKKTPTTSATAQDAA